MIKKVLSGFLTCAIVITLLLMYLSGRTECTKGTNGDPIYWHITLKGVEVVSTNTIEAPIDYWPPSYKKEAMGE